MGNDDSERMRIKSTNNESITNLRIHAGDSFIRFFIRYSLISQFASNSRLITASIAVSDVVMTR